MQIPTCFYGSYKSVQRNCQKLIKRLTKGESWQTIFSEIDLLEVGTTPGSLILDDPAPPVRASENHFHCFVLVREISKAHQELATSFSGIDTPIADSHRQKALETAQGRDQATYQLALVYRAQNQPELAVPLLVQIIRSQQPIRDLGKKAYAQLVELGFADTPFPRPVQSSNNR
ncbi:MAG: hypothetical protein VKJ24_16030 [Synechococcales bacterium]|nr:hypothetical protein [Synechococcales bacterium]